LIYVFYIKENDLNNLKLIAILIYERNKINGSIDFGIKVYYENIFVIFVICMFFCFLNDN